MKRTNKEFIEVDGEGLRALKTASQVALLILGGAAALTIAVALPGLSQVLGGQLKKMTRNERRRIYIRERYDPLRKNGKNFSQSRRTLYYLRSKGYITFNSRLQNATISLTAKGKTYLRKLLLVAEPPRKPDVWDKTWWVVMADIPTKTHRGQAELFRMKLKTMGFYALQRTVWVHPYNPLKSVNELTNYFDLGKFVTIFQATHLDLEDLAKLKKHFKL